MKFYEAQPKDMKELEVEKKRKFKKGQNNGDFLGEISDDDFSFGSKEHLNMLHVSLVIQFIKNEYKKPLAKKMLRRLLQSMESQYTRGIQNLRKCAIEKLFGFNDIPIYQVKSHYADKDEEKQKLADEYKDIFDRDFYTTFSKAIVSLYFQSHGREFEITQCLKQEEQRS